MFCETCFVDVASVSIGGQVACADCGTLLFGGPLVHTAAFTRKAHRPEKIHKSVDEAIVASRVADSLSPTDQRALARVTQASVAAAFAGGRAPAGAARAIANRVIDEIASTAPCETMKRAEDVIVVSDKRAAGKAREGAALLHRARTEHGACLPSLEISEGAWALAAIAVAVCGPPRGDDLESLAREVVIRCDLPVKNVCKKAIVQVFQYGFEKNL